MLITLDDNHQQLIRRDVALMKLKFNDNRANPEKRNVYRECNLDERTVSVGQLRR